MSAVYLGNNVLLAKTLLGHKIYLDSQDVGITPHIAMDGTWESWVGNAMSPYLRNSYFFDIGANVGWFSLLAHAAGAKEIFAYEPNDKVFGLLKDTAQVNGMRAHLFCIALSDADGRGTLHVDKSYPGSGTLLSGGVSSGSGNGQSVFTFQLDTLVRAEELPPLIKGVPRVFKIDVEGLEPQVVQGAKATILAPETAAVFLEYNSYSTDITRMFDLFEEGGFQLGYVKHTGEILQKSRAAALVLPDASMLCFRRFQK